MQTGESFKMKRKNAFYLLIFHVWAMMIKVIINDIRIVINDI
jgi:hypothetical protein